MNYNAVCMLRDICIKYKWFTGGTNDQYDKLFDMVHKGRSIKELVLVIYLCTYGYNEKSIKDILRREGFLEVYKSR